MDPSSSQGRKKEKGGGDIGRSQALSPHKRSNGGKGKGLPHLLLRKRGEIPFTFDRKGVARAYYLSSETKKGKVYIFAPRSYFFTERAAAYLRDRDRESSFL